MIVLELERRKRNLSQKDLAEKVGVHASYVSMIEQLHAQPSDNFRKKASVVLRLPQKILFKSV